ncbi:hypothetical protein PCE1_004185 [Barthelona sp. PCE]
MKQLWAVFAVFLCTCSALSTLYSNENSEYYDRNAQKLFNGERWVDVSVVAYDSMYDNNLYYQSNFNTSTASVKRWAYNSVYNYTTRTCIRRDSNDKCKEYRTNYYSHTYRVNLIHVCNQDYCISTKLPLAPSKYSQTSSYAEGTWKSDPFETFLSITSRVPSETYSLEPIDVNSAELKEFICVMCSSYTLCVRGYDFPWATILIVIGIVILVVVGIFVGAKLKKKMKHHGIWL